MSIEEIAVAIKESKTFDGFVNYRKVLTSRRTYAIKLHDLYHQTRREGLDYIKRNPNSCSYDVQLIEEILNNTAK